MRDEMYALKDRVILARRAYSSGQAEIEAVYAAADAYIAALKAYRKASGKKVPIPSRGYLLRAI